MRLGQYSLQAFLVFFVATIGLGGLISACGATGSVVEGTIMRAGEPVRGAIVNLSASIAESDQAASAETPTTIPDEVSTKTDEQGRYRFEGVAPGTKIVTLNLEVTGLSCIAMHIVEASRGQPVTQNFEVPTSTFNVGPMLPDGAIVACKR